ncbi:glycosyltransferase [Candidatus Sumerlaeota bacterium]|nr:glycosyltransferase [Candidatus Sumerlaeota bacterium]
MSRNLQVAVAAPETERCGVYDYARHLADAMPDDVEIRWVAYPTGDSAAAWRRAAGETRGADLVHVHYEHGLFRLVKPFRNRFAAFMNNLRAPAVVTLHGPMPSLVPRWRRKRPYGVRDAFRDLAYLAYFSKWAVRDYGRAAHWIVHTRPRYDEATQYAAPDRVTLLMHPIPRPTTSWRLEAVAERLFVTPGFIKEHKGYERFLETLRRIPGWRWTLAGGPQNARDTDYLARLRDRIVRLELTDRVEITGYLPRERFESLVSRAAVAVFPYERAEGSGSLSLALGLGMPVAATDVPAFRETAEAGAGIELLPNEAPESWGAALQSLVEDSSRLDRLARANARFADSHSYERGALELASLFRSVASRNARRAEVSP